MATLTYNSLSYTVDHAVKGANFIHGYDAKNNLVVAFDGVTSFSGFSYSGTYMAPDTCLQEKCNTVKHVEGELVREDGSPATHIHDGSDIASGLDVLAANMGAVRTECGSYQGTGSYGAETPNSLTFNFKPKMVLVYPDDSALTGATTPMMMLWAGQTGSATHGSIFTFDENTNTLSWYSNPGSANNGTKFQCNANGKTYHWFAFY